MNRQTLLDWLGKLEPIANNTSENPREDAYAVVAQINSLLKEPSQSPVARVDDLERGGRVRTPATVKGDAELNASTLRCAMNWALDVLANLCDEIPHPTGDITERCFALPQVQSWNCFGGYPHRHGFDSLTHAVSFLFSNDLGEMRCWDDHPGYEDVLTVMMWALDEKACASGFRTNF